MPLILDVTDAGQIEAAAERIEAEVGEAGLDGLVNNAGIAVPGPLETLPIDDFRRQVDVNLTAQVAVTQAMLPAIRTARGRIVFITSIGGLMAFPMFGAYHAAKFGLEAVGDVFRQELRPWGIKVAVVEPGSIATPIWERGEAEVDEIADARPRRPQGPLRQGDRRLPRGGAENRRARHPAGEGRRAGSSTRSAPAGPAPATWSAPTPAARRSPAASSRLASSTGSSPARPGCSPGVADIHPTPGW